MRGGQTRGRRVQAVPVALTASTPNAGQVIVLARGLLLAAGGSATFDYDLPRQDPTPIRRTGAEPIMYAGGLSEVDILFHR
jgi:hypothetical protein